MDLAESNDLLDMLFEHCTQDHFQYRHKWSVGDLLLWDNRCTMHHATTNVLPADIFRTILRINTRGTAPA